MAKPRPIVGLDPDRRLRPNARRILATRIAEVWDFGPAVTHPGNVRELHDMRIACKRLRYLLEIFSIAFPGDLDPELDHVKNLQDLLGEIHDCDVQIPMLHEHLERLAEREAETARMVLRETAPLGGVTRPRHDEAFETFRLRIDAAGTVPLRPGIQALLSRRTRERDELYERFLGMWRRLQDERFRARLERTLGV